MNEINIQQAIKQTKDHIFNAYTWLNQNLFSFATMYQLGCTVVIFFISFLLSKRARVFLEKQKWKSKFLKSFIPLSLYLIWLPLQWIASIVAKEAGLPFHVMEIVASLLTAWIFIRLFSSFIDNVVLRKTISITIWIVAAMNIIGLLDEAITVFDKIAISFGDIRISALGAIKTFIAITILLAIVSALSKVVDKRLSKYSNISPSAQVLFSKLLNILFLTIVFIVALNTLGIDLTAFAVFGGALGVGIGFGLQKVISNFVSGLILLMERSIKPGDVLAINQTYGWVQSLGARYVSLVTRDGTEHLIPNEEFITQRVENWSHSDDKIRLRIPVGISYKSDLDLAIKLCLETASETQRVLKDPEPRCLLRGFGDSSIDLEIRIWIIDPAEGRANITSEIYHSIWKKFNKHGIEIPYPQRDMHLKTSDAAELTKKK